MPSLLFHELQGFGSMAQWHIFGETSELLFSETKYIALFYIPIFYKTHKINLLT